MISCMKRSLIILLGLMCVFSLCMICPRAETSTVFSSSARETTINDSWMFTLGDISGAESPDYDDSSWREINLPHDWSIEGKFSTEGEAESGFLLGGTGWYRKTLILPERLKDKRMVLNFDGVYMNSTVYVNGKEAGTHPFGYTPFMFDLTGLLVCDGESKNVIAVKVENLQPNSRWYSGSGIYRDVSLIVSEKTAVAPYGIQIRTPSLAESPEKGETGITIHIDNTLPESKKISVRNTILDHEGKAVSDTQITQITVDKNSTGVCSETLYVSDPVLWSTKEPVLYTLRTEIRTEDGHKDVTETAFGYRYYQFDPKTGFTLNGVPMKLKGVCLHHDQGALGSKAYTRAMERQLELMKNMGANAVRITHNPADRDMIALCDRMGLLVIEEAFDTWSNSKNFNFYDYGMIFNEQITGDNRILGGKPGMTWAEYDIKQMVLRDRNSPSVILWSIGNEILGNIGGDISSYPAYSANLVKWVRECDDTRPATIGDNKTESGNITQAEMNRAIVDAQGVIGLNYVHGETYDGIHETYPYWPLYASETISAFYTRSYYKTYNIDYSTFQTTGFDTAHAEWGSSAEDSWMDIITRDYLAGEFIWTGMDYIGEPEPWNGLTQGSVTALGAAPRSNFFGVTDTAGIPKDIYYFYQSQWNDEVNTLHILPTWNREEIQIDESGYTDVIVYSDAPSVELTLNGESLGKKSYTVHTTEQGYSWQECDGHLYYSWQVPYTEGTLEAHAYNEKGEELFNTEGRYEVKTHQNASEMILEADHPLILADHQSISYILIQLTDPAGIPVTGEDVLLHMELTGNGRIVGVDNGDPRDTTSFLPEEDTSVFKRTFHGACVLIVQSTDEEGTINLRVTAEGINEAETQIASIRIYTGLEGILNIKQWQDLEITGLYESMLLPEIEVMS